MNNKFFYEDKFNQFKEEKNSLDKKFSNISTLRALSFLAGLALLLIGVFDGQIICGVLGVIFLVVFLYLVKIHGDVVKCQEIAKSKADVARKYVDRFSDAWRSFEDDGEEFLTEGDTVSKDIDLLGKASLYQLLNTAHTKKGKELFADDLRLNRFDLNKLKYH